MANQNSKTAKNSQFQNYLSAILHLAPFNLSGINVCPAASKGCAMACLNTAGRGRFDNVQEARIRKTKLFFGQRDLFFTMLLRDIDSLCRKAAKQNQIPVLRLNGTSDIDWENIEVFGGMNIFDLYKDAQFYDYTKRPDRVLNNDYPNYHLTFSMSEVNETIAKRILKAGFNVATVFRDIPEVYQGFKVLNGDDHDLRFLEGNQGLIIGLTAKGKAKNDITGFVK